MKYKKISIPHLPITVRFCITKEPLKARNSLVKTHGLNKFPDEKFAGLTSHDEEGCFWMTFEEECPISTVTHEAFHCVAYIFQHLDIKHDADNNEHFAYLLDYVVGEIIKYNDNNS